MKLNEVKIVKNRIEKGSVLLPVPMTEVIELEREIGAVMPKGYAEWMTTFGQGFYNDYLRVHPPARIKKEYKSWQKHFQEYWFWDAAHDILPKERGVECILIGDTMDGDALVFHPSRPDQLYVLPRDEGYINIKVNDDQILFLAGSTLEEAVTWMCESGVLEKMKRKEFKPFNT